MREKRNRMLSIAAPALLFFLAPTMLIATIKTSTITVEVNGLSCPFCAYGLKKHLKRIPGVLKVKVSLKKGLVRLETKPGANISDEAIRKAVIKAGFKAGEIKRLTKSTSDLANPEYRKNSSDSGGLQHGSIF